MKEGRLSDRSNYLGEINVGVATLLRSGQLIDPFDGKHYSTTHISAQNAAHRLVDAIRFVLSALYQINSKNKLDQALVATVTLQFQLGTPALGIHLVADIAKKCIETKNLSWQFKNAREILSWLANPNSAFYREFRRRYGLGKTAQINAILAIPTQLDSFSNLTQKLRNGVMEKIGLDFESAKALNPGLIYGVVTGYGDEGEWVGKPGQDLLAQSMSGLTQLSGNADDPPIPVGIAVSDIMCGTHLVQGLLAALVQKGISGKGALVEVNLMESLMDLQFELLTTYLNDGRKPPKRSASNNANAYLGAPYGIYECAVGHIALAMGSLPKLGELLDCAPLLAYTDQATWFTKRDEIKDILAKHLKTQPVQHWLDILEPADIWCAPVLD